MFRKIFQKSLKIKNDTRVTDMRVIFLFANNIVVSVENGLGIARIFEQVQGGENRAHPKVRKAFCRRGNCSKRPQ